MHPFNPHPHDTLTTFTGASVQEFRSAPMDIRRAVRACCELDILCEHIVRYGHERHMSPARFSAEREKLFEAEPALRTIRDVHDTHKHGPLGRKSATIKSGRPAQFKWTGASSAFGAGAFGEAAFSESPTVSLVIATNTEAALALTVVEKAFSFLIEEMHSRGLLPK